MAESSGKSAFGQPQKSLELKNRTKQFAVRCLKLIENLPYNTTAKVISNQLARSATSVGANYRASCRSRSRREFVSKISITLEEADESQYWLELVVELDLMPASRINPLLNEANQLIAIFSKSRATARKKHSPNHTLKES